MRDAITALQVFSNRTSARVESAAGQIRGWRAAVALAVFAALFMIVLAVWPSESMARDASPVPPVPWPPAERDEFLPFSSNLTFTRAITEPSEWELADTPWPTYQHDFRRTGRSPYVGITMQPAIRPKLNLQTAYGLSAGPGNTLYHKGLDGTHVVDLNTHHLLSASLPGKDCISAPTILRNGNVCFGSWYFGTFDAAGELLWGYQPANICINQTPAVDARGIVYFVLDSTLAAADAATGQLFWIRSMGSIEGGGTPALGADGTVYIPDGEQLFYALNPDGSIKWSSPYGARSGAAIGDDRTIYSANDGLLTAFHPDGTIRWQFSFEGNACPHSSVALAPNGTIYLGTYWAAHQAAESWLYAVNPDGTEKWRFPVFGQYPQICISPVTDNQSNVYFCDGSGVCYALDAYGNHLWDLTFDQAVGAPPVITADGIMYLSSADWLYQLADPALPLPDTMKTRHLPLVSWNRPVVVVDSTEDAVDANVGDGRCATTAGHCTLRAAIQELNLATASKSIVLPAGVYELTLRGSEDEGLQGDLDVLGDIIIKGAGRESTIVRTGGWDRVFDVRRNGLLELRGLTVSGGGSVDYGGCIYQVGDVRLVDSAVVECSARLGGGGICQGRWADAGGETALQGSIVRNNSAPEGGGIYSTGDLDIMNSTICQNSADHGAGAYSDPNRSWLTWTIKDSVIDGNVASSHGGGLKINDILYVTIEGSTVSNNRASTGAGIVAWSGAVIEIEDTTIISNTADYLCGGLIMNQGNLWLANSTVSGNASINDGGGMCFYGYMLGTVMNSTITNNRADTDRDGKGDGGGIFTGSGFTGNLLLRNTILAGNHDLSPAVGDREPDCAGDLASVRYNLIGNNNGCSASFVPGAMDDLVGTAAAPLDPRLGPLGNYGGKTMSHALLAGSLAIDGGGIVRCPGRDQRGTARLQDGNGDGVTGCDIGAYEFERRIFFALFTKRAGPVLP